MHHSVYFALGGRDGDPVKAMAQGLARLALRGVDIGALSSLWETEPVNLPPGGPVFNAAAGATTRLRPQELLSLFHETEEAAGRRRGCDGWRSLDLDILLIGALRIPGPGLEIPHARFHTRRFNLAPLAEIAPQARHPLLGATIEDLLAACEDPAWVRSLPGTAGGSWAEPGLHRSGASGKIAHSPLSTSRRAPGYP
jgi:2-amino-4-hydroxy-6-hydroxymethyldihydropteridine diphosphokinase